MRYEKFTSPLERQIYDVFDSFLTGESQTIPTDIIETESSFIIEMEIPGLTKDNITIDAIESQLMITINPTDVAKLTELPDDAQYLRRNRTTRSMPVECPFNFKNMELDPTTIKATCINGVLNVNIKKKTVRSKRVTID
jgi:HSP20 family protein